MTNQRAVTPFRQKLELLLLTQREDVLSRVRKTIADHLFTFKHGASLEDLKEGRSEVIRALVIVVSQEESEHIGAFSERILVLLERFPLSTVITVMHESALKDDFSGTQYSRVVPLSPFEFFKTYKFDYICMLRCRSQFFDIAPSDLFSMTTLTFTVFVRMSLNQRFLGVAFRGAMLSDVKYQKMLKKDALYIHGREVIPYLEYINSYFDQKGASLRKRVRATFLGICAVWFELSEYLLFDFKTYNDEAINKLYADLENLGRQLLDLLKSDDDLWDVLKDVIQNELLEAWRSPWIAVYAAYISQRSQVGNPLDAFMAGLLCDVGLFDISKDVFKKYHDDGEASLVGDELAEYQKHPMLSLNRVMAKRIPVSEAIKAILVCVHERADEKGFPSQTPVAGLPMEAFLIHFAELIDFGVRITMKESGSSFRIMKEKLWEKEQSNPGSFPVEFLNKISESLI